MGVDILKLDKEGILNLKIVDISGFLSPEQILHIAKHLGAYWAYDYEAAKEGRVGLHAELKSGLHSDGFFVSRILLAPENILRIIALQMAMKLEPIFKNSGKPDWMAGVPEGASMLGNRIAGIFGIKVAKMHKIQKVMQLDTGIGMGDTIMLVEDICTRGTGFKEAVSVVKQKQPKANLFPFDPVILNRGGLESFDFEHKTFRVSPIVNIRINDYEPEKCKLCELGSKVIKPKETDENWELINNSQK